MREPFVAFGNKLINMNSVVSIAKYSVEIPDEQFFKYFIKIVDTNGKNHDVDYGEDQSARDHMFNYIKSALCFLTE